MGIRDTRVSRITDKENNQPEPTMKGYFDLFTPVRLSSELDEKMYVEYMLNSSSRVDKIAKIGDYRSSDFTAGELVAERAYAQVGNNFFSASPDMVAKQSNEHVKMNLAKSYYSNPQEYTLKLIDSILSNLQKNYTLTEKEIATLREKGKNKERLDMFNFTDNKINNGDKKLMSAVKTINYLMDNLEEVEKFQNNTFAKFAKGEFKKYLRENCFGNDFNWQDVDPIQKDKLMYYAVERDRDNTEKMLKQIGYSAKAEVLNDKINNLFKYTKNVSDAHSKIETALEIGSVINSDVKIKEQLLMLESFEARAEELLEDINNSDDPKSKAHEIFVLKKDARMRAAEGEPNSFTGIFREIDDKIGSNLVKRVQSKKKLDLDYFKKHIQAGIQKKIKDKLIQAGVGNDGVKAIAKNYKDLSRKIQEAEKKGTATPAHIDDLHKEFEKNNFKILLNETKGNNPLVEKMVSQNESENFLFSREITDDKIEKAAEIMNAYNIAANESIDIQPDEAEGVAKQSLNDKNLKENIVDITKSKKLEKDELGKKRDIIS